MVYENVLSVSFIYAMGVYRGKNADAAQVLMDSINYYQQTPADPTIGDLLAHWNGKVFIIEFKKTRKQLATEIKKETKANLFMALQKDPSKLELSARGHFIGYGKYETIEGKTVADLIFQPYISLMYYERAPIDRFNTFIQKLSADKAYGWTKPELEQYTDFLKANVSSTDGDSATGSAGGKGVKETEGLITVVCQENKILTLHFRSHQELYLLLDKNLSLSQWLAIQKAQSQQINQTIEQKKDKNISRGMGGP